MLLGAYQIGSSNVEAIAGIGNLSGDIFQRGAGLTMLQTAWVREGQPAGWWDTSPLG
jgi:hypothetical protein